MKIEEIVHYQVEIPTHSILKTGFGTVSSKPTVITKITTTDGYIGYGESSSLPAPIYNPESAEIDMLVLKNYLDPLIIGKDLKTVEEAISQMKIIKGFNIAKCGIENALCMIYCQMNNISLKEYLGGKYEKIAVGESIGIKPRIEETLEAVQNALDRNFKRIKLKIEPGWDIEVVEKVRSAFGDISLMVDANSSYSINEIETLKKLDRYNLLMIEQPLGSDDIIDHSYLQSQINTPVCLDESILSLDDARKAIKINACKIINIKPGRVGGIIESKKIAEFCEKEGVGTWVGGMLELGIGKTFNIAVASLENVIYPSDMSPINEFFTEDIVNDPFEIDNEGYIKVPNTPGLGFEINEEIIKKYTVRKEVTQHKM